ncbi:MAG: HPr(Ser) kinase/phosphatase [Eubacterium sp.]|jgi:HPr kinase/phosphorylase|nr:HPr(Ser) kinase/phosphatase [Eubacterium sp.]MCI9566229.1 HPr(Ser) kinase/phosphatase [Eubacterium sp.]MCI9618280.1 HPr(Ser) kinase/phosphatase [Eubacterium sp.]
MSDIFIPFTKVVDNYGLVNHTPEINTDEVKIIIPEVNRPALQLAGFFEHFDKERVQIIGNVECAFLDNMQRQNRQWVYEKLMSSGIPCLILCRGNKPDDDLISAGLKYGVPIMSTDTATSSFNAELSRWLNVELAPCITRHGVLVDVYGEGVLIMGESGIGKSEAALELIKRGHRLVTDDVVEIRRVSDETLIGTSPAITKHFIELRGIGIIDVKALFGVESILDSASIDMVIQLEEWSRDKEYDRMCLEERYTEFLGNKVVCHKIPIRPGRNLAVIVEAAAVNHRQKRMGYNAAVELYNRVQKNMMGENE